MKNRYILLFLCALLTSLTSCIEDLLPIRGNGILVVESRRSGTFNGIENSTSIDIIYKKADSTSITIQADENLLQYIVTETINNNLEIKHKPGYSYLDYKERPLITITSPSLGKTIITGSGNFVADNMSGEVVVLNMTGSGDISAQHITCPNLSVLLSGSGGINIKDCLTSNADLFISGSGDISVMGEGVDCNIKITGSGEVLAESFPLASGSVIITGSGNIFTNVENNLTAIISGSGNIYLKGNPIVNKTITGSGRIINYK